MKLRLAKKIANNPQRYSPCQHLYAYCRLRKWRFQRPAQSAEYRWSIVRFIHDRLVYRALLPYLGLRLLEVTIAAYAYEVAAEVAYYFQKRRFTNE